MAKRQARPAPQDLESDPRLQDESAELWDPSLTDLARRLLASAVQCFAANGYHATTTRDITSVVGVTPAALYLPFSSKEGVLYEIARVSHEHALDALRGPEVDAAEGPAAKLRLVVQRYSEVHARYHVAARVAQYELNGLSEEHYEEILRLRRETNEIFHAIIGQGVADGTFGSVDVNRVTRAIQSLVIDLARWYRLDGSDSPEQLGQYYGELALHMVAADATA
jgi:AcrR family transcriptional regulator